MHFLPLLLAALSQVHWRHLFQDCMCPTRSNAKETTRTYLYCLIIGEFMAHLWEERKIFLCLLCLPGSLKFKSQGQALLFFLTLGAAGGRPLTPRFVPARNCFAPDVLYCRIMHYASGYDKAVI